MRYKSALTKADEICVRDAYSKQVVEKCYARTPLIYPDIVFLYGKEKKTHDKNSKGKKVCCNVLSYDYYKNAGGGKSKEEYFDEWKEILDSYTDSNTIIIVDLPVFRSFDTKQRTGIFFRGSKKVCCI